MKTPRFTNELAWLWLKSKRLSPKYKAVILQMSEEEVADAFQTNKMHFGTAGIRAILGPGTNRLNFFTFQQIAAGYSLWLKKQTNTPFVIIGHDSRKNADFYTYLVAYVLTSFGIKVALFAKNELVATPIVAYAVKSYQASGGIVITASHNPKNYLGFKVYGPNGSQLLEADSAAIQMLMPNNDSLLNNFYQPQKELISFLAADLKQKYFATIQTNLELVTKNPPINLPIVYTAHHGCGCYDMFTFLQQLGYANIISVKEQNQPDSEFSYSNHINPENIASFTLSLQYAKRYNADLILATDPDVDRFAFAFCDQEQWYFPNGNEIAVLFIYYLLTTKQFSQKPFLVTTYVSTNYIDQIAASLKAIVIRTNTGFKWISSMIERYQNKYTFLLGFEEALGYLLSFEVNKDKDAFQATALLLEIYLFLKKQNQTFKDYFRSIYQKFGCWKSYHTSYHFMGLNPKKQLNDKYLALSKLKIKKIADWKVYKIKKHKNTYLLEWFLDEQMVIKIRPSGTENKLKIYYELYAKSFLQIQKNFCKLEKALDALLKNS